MSSLESYRLGMLSLGNRVRLYFIGPMANL